MPYKPPPLESIRAELVRAMTQQSEIARYLLQIRGAANLETAQALALEALHVLTNSAKDTPK